jgi:hypothetical protein
MTFAKRFGRFWVSFLIGDNLLLAAGAGVAIGLTAILVDQGVNAWWLLPPAILGLLAASAFRASHRTER